MAPPSQESGLPARSLALAGCRDTALLGQLRLDARRRDPGHRSWPSRDHINFSGFNPLATEREGQGWDTPYLSMAELYDEELTLTGCAGPVEAAGVPFPTGVAGLLDGPQLRDAG